MVHGHQFDGLTHFNRLLERVGSGIYTWILDLNLWLNRIRRRLVLEGCDQVVRIPMEGQVASLNAAAAGTVVLYEALRQRMRNVAPSATRTPPPPRAAPVMPSEQEMNDEELTDEDLEPTAGETIEDDKSDERVPPVDEADESAAPVDSDVAPEDETAITDEAVAETADAAEKPKKRVTRAKKTTAARKTPARKKPSD